MILNRARFGAPHETAIANHYDLQVFITNYPTN